MRAQDGFGLIEVLVSALIVACGAIAVGAALDAAGHASGRDRSRAIAAGLAQADQERLRGLDPGDLNALIATPQARTQHAGNVDYTIRSTASAQSDPEANPDCGGDASDADYLSLKSTVTWPNMRVQPVVQQSLASVPPNGTGGKVVIQVQDRNGDPEAGTTVTMTGGRNASADTSAKGCVVFDNVPAGTAQLTLSRPGYVDVNGNATWSKDVTITNNRTTSVGPVSYDQAGSATVTFTTTLSGFTYTGGTTNRVTATQPGMGAARQFGDPAQFVSSIDTGATLFPFASSYGFWAGDCAAEDPANNHSPAISQRISPGATTAVVISLPAINLTVKYSSTLLSNADVWFTPTAGGCGSDAISAGSTTSGKIAFPGIPYGDYTACAHYVPTAAEATSLGIAVGDYKATTAFTRGSGTPPVVTLDFAAGGTAGTCP